MVRSDAIVLLTAIAAEPGLELADPIVPPLQALAEPLYTPRIGTVTGHARDLIDRFACRRVAEELNQRADELDAIG